MKGNYITMKNRIKLFSILLLISAILGIHNYTTAAVKDLDPVQTINRLNNQNKPSVSTPAKTSQTSVKASGQTASATTSKNTAKNYVSVSPLQIVQQPKFYLGKNVKFRAKFDKFSTIGLDYKPAFRSSEKFISLLIQRPDVAGNDIPLSELKIFVDRENAEKNIDLNSGDEIELSGYVFSIALGDPWMSVDDFKVLKTTPAKIIK